MRKIHKKKKAVIISVIVIIASITGIILTLTFGFKPTLKNLLVEFGDWDPLTNRSGSFLFIESQEKVFLEFGAQVESPSGPKLLPTFEYRVLANSNVYAPCDGFITYMRFQEDTNDYEIFIAPNALSWVKVSVDHISNPQFSFGQFVRAGDILGNPGPWGDGLGRVELMVNYGDGGHYAPFAFFDPVLKETYETLVWEHMKDWEDFINNSSLYDENSMIYAGCLYEVLNENELQL
ncbi:MAG: hypothetical protein KGD67_07875 [Candidatus Lokiarchaeota archaeon]|nr:hypothetical protein [Candidatus Lokiarchaeota archaeon]